MSITMACEVFLRLRPIVRHGITMMSSQMCAYKITITNNRTISFCHILQQQSDRGRSRCVPPIQRQPDRGFWKATLPSGISRTGICGRSLEIRRLSSLRYIKKHAFIKHESQNRSQFVASMPIFASQHCTTN